MSKPLNYVWTNEMIEFLINNFEDNNNKYLSSKLNIPVSSLSKKACKLGLHKDKDYLLKMRDKRNKQINITRKKLPSRNLTYEDLKEIALKYKTRYQFQLSDSRAYFHCNKMKILDDVCSHMLMKKVSVPQLLLFEMIKKILPDDNIVYNNRKVIKPYEIDIYSEKYKLGFEYNGKYWHTNNKSDLIKNNLCLKNSINLIVLNEKSKNMKNYFNDIKEQLISNLPLINIICNINISDIDVNNINENETYFAIKPNILNMYDIKLIISKYKYYTDFRKNKMSLCLFLQRNNLLDEYTGHLIRRSVNLDINNIIKTIAKYVHHSDFVRENLGLYKYIKYRKLDYLLENLINNRVRWNLEKIVEVIKSNKYNKIEELRKKYYAAYHHILKNNLYDECSKLILIKNE